MDCGRILAGEGGGGIIRQPGPKVEPGGFLSPDPLCVGHTGPMGRHRLRASTTSQRQDFTSGGSLYVGCVAASQDAARGLNTAAFDVCFDCTITDQMLHWCRDSAPQAQTANVSWRPASRPVWPQSGRVLFEGPYVVRFFVRFCLGSGLSSKCAERRFDRWRPLEGVDGKASVRAVRINAVLADPPEAAAKVEEDFAPLFACLAAGLKTLVHCVHGKHRSLGERTSHDKYLRQYGAPLRALLRTFSKLRREG